MNFEFRDLLVLAAERDLRDVLQLFLDKGTHDTVDKVSSSGETPLTAAARAGKYDTVSFLLERGACVHGSTAATIENRNKNFVEHEDIDCEDSQKNEDEYKRLFHSSHFSFVLRLRCEPCRSS